MASTKHNGSKDWRTQLQEAEELHLKCASKGDFTEWFQVYPPRPFDKAAAASPPDPNQAMWQPTAKNLVTQHKQIANNIQNTSNNLKATNATQAECDKELDDSQAQAIADSTAAIKKVYADAKAKINELPTAAQQPATDGFVDVMNTFSTFWSNVLGDVQKVVDEIAAWLQNVWQDVSQAWDDVKDTFESAASWVESL